MGPFLFQAILSVCTVAVSSDSIKEAFAGRAGSFVIIECASGATIFSTENAESEQLPPCSTFKIWNTLIGLESGLVASPEEAFYQWDGQTRSYPDWNRNLTLKEAFRVSCVPAYQGLARKIGPERMQFWLNRIDYGNKDISAGIDLFWLPAPGRRTLLITSSQQAQLMAKLVCGKMPFSKKAQQVLKEIMAAKTTDQGSLYGKTGSGKLEGATGLGWYVGYVESAGKCCAFACALRGEGVTGKEARAAVEEILKRQTLL